MCSRGDLPRSIPFIMCGHLSMIFFQTLAASILDTNPLRTYQMMSFKHRGQALRPFPHQFHGMSPHDMSLHDKQTFSWFFWYHSFPNSNLLSSVYKKKHTFKASVNIPSIPWYVPPWYVQTWWTKIKLVILILFFVKLKSFVFSE